MPDRAPVPAVRLDRAALLHYADGLDRVGGRVAARLRDRCRRRAAQLAADPPGTAELLLSAAEWGLLRRLDERDAQALAGRPVA